MTQENKELLLKDLCARLPYGVKVKAKVPVSRTDYKEFIDKVISISYNINIVQVGSFDVIVDYEPHFEIKPYLFPLSSMTEEQKKEYEDALTYHDYVEGGWTIAKSFDNEYIIPYWFVDFCNKNHIDYRGLIPKGLAIDATGLNVY